MAASGPSMRGPLRSSLTSGERDGKPSTTAARRRGVAKVFISLCSSPASPSAFARRRARSWRARVCIRAGISSENNSSRSSAIGAARLGLEPRRATGLGEVAHAQNIGLALRHRDHAAGIEQIENMRGLDRLVVGRQHHHMALAVLAPGEQRPAFGFGVAEMVEQEVGVGVLEIEARVFLLSLQEHVAIGDLVLPLPAVEIEIEHAVDAMHIHGEALQPIGELARDRVAIEAADLLEIGELGHLHTVQPYLPAEAPSAKGRALPVVLDEADVMLQGIDADGDEALEIEVLEVGGRRLQDHLELVVMLEPVRVLAVAAVLGAAARLHIGGAPRLGPKRAQGGGGMKGRSPHLHVVRLEDDAALIGPEALEPEDQVLEGQGAILSGFAWLGHVFGTASGKFLWDGLWKVGGTLKQNQFYLNRHARPKCRASTNFKDKQRRGWPGETRP